MGYFDGINWSDLLQSAGIIGNLLLTSYVVYKDGQARKISYLNASADRHWEIWKDLRGRAALSRVLEKNVDLNAQPVTHEEELIVTQLIIHLETVFRAMKAGMFVKVEGLKRDIKEFFMLPIPKAVWDKSKRFREVEFICFVESAWQSQ